MAAALQAQRQHGLPELRPLPAPDDLRERRLRPAAQGRPGRRGQERASRRCSSSSSCPASSGASRPRSRAARPSASRSPAPSINKPAVLLLDEPLGALDLKLRKQMQVELKRIQQEVGITFIYVTHDQEEAMTMSDRIAVMNKGRYEQLGDPESLYERPQHPVRRGLPRRQQPPAGGRPGQPTGTTPRSSSPTTRPSAPRAPCRGPDARRASAFDPRRSACASPTRRRRTGTTSCAASSATRRTWGSARSTRSRRAGGARLTVYEQNVERATRAELWAPGEEVLLTWSPDHSFVVRRSDARRTTSVPA